MNKENNQLICDTFVDAIEWLEKHIEKANYYSDWEERKTIQISSITRPDIGTMEAVRARRCFLVALKGLEVNLGFRENKSFPKEDLKTKFFQWIAAVKISSDNCPADLGLLLYYFHEVLEGRGEEFFRQSSKKADKEISKMSKEEREKGWSDYHSEVMKQYQKVEETENREFNPDGSAEQGQASFKKIVSTISKYITEIDNLKKELETEKAKPKLKANDTDPRDTHEYKLLKSELTKWTNAFNSSTYPTPQHVAKKITDLQNELASKTDVSPKNQEKINNFDKLKLERDNLVEDRDKWKRKFEEEKTKIDKEKEQTSKIYQVVLNKQDNINSLTEQLAKEKEKTKNLEKDIQTLTNEKKWLERQKEEDRNLINRQSEQIRKLARK